MEKVGEAVVELPVARLKPSKTQPREIFDPRPLDDLTKSIAANGVLIPALVRAQGGGYYDIVDGERRWRASKAAGKKTIPAIVREMTDEEAAKVQLIVGLQREGLTEIEEARAYQRLMKVFGLTADEVAATVKKSGKKAPSRRYIYDRLALLHLGDAAKNALLAGKLPPSIAALGSTLEPKKQAEFVKKVLADGEASTFREAERILQEVRTPALVKAPAQMAAATPRADVVRAALPHALKALRAAAAKEASAETATAATALLLAAVSQDAAKGAAEALGLAARWTPEGIKKALWKYVDDAKPGEVRALALHLAARLLAGGRPEEWPPELAAAAKALGVDLRAAERAGRD